MKHMDASGGVAAARGRGTEQGLRERGGQENLHAGTPYALRTTAKVITPRPRSREIWFLS